MQSDYHLGSQGMHSVKVKVKYSPNGGTPNGITYTTVYVMTNPPTESEVTAAIRKANPQWNFIILEID
jgi:hypothetical protein